MLRIIRKFLRHAGRAPLAPMMLCTALLFYCPPLPAAESELPSPEAVPFEPLRFELPQIEKSVTDNGMTLYILENHDLPVIHLNGLIKTGSVYDPPGKEGTAELTAYVMRTGGTEKYTSAQMDNLLDDMAATVAFTVSKESVQVNFSVLSEDFEKGLELLSEIMIHPIFEREKIELARQLKEEELRRLRDNPQKLAFREFLRLVYDGDDRGRFASSASIKKISREDLADFHRIFFRPENIMFAVSGDISSEKAKALIKKYFGGWRAEGKTMTFPPPPKSPREGLFIVSKEIPQSTVVAGRLGPAKTDEDFYAFTVLDFIIGSGGFPSRIQSLVRNDEGLAYSAGSFYQAYPSFGVFGVYALTKTPSTLRALGLMNSVVESIGSSVSEQELVWAKKSINNGFIFSFTTPQDIVWQIMNADYDHLPSDFLPRFRERIEKVTVADLAEAARRYFSTQNTVLILGDSKNFLEGKPSDQYVFITPEY
ncbi:MAG TPA: pitrilysin family protein [Smithella sp.]|nr:pitrilysin family protein [Smithella sp.]